MCLTIIDGKLCALEGRYMGYCFRHAQIHFAPELAQKIVKIEENIKLLDSLKEDLVLEYVEASKLQAEIYGALEGGCKAKVKRILEKFNTVNPEQSPEEFQKRAKRPRISSLDDLTKINRTLGKLQNPPSMPLEPFKLTGDEVDFASISGETPAKST